MSVPPCGARATLVWAVDVHIRKDGHEGRCRIFGASIGKNPKNDRNHAACGCSRKTFEPLNKICFGWTRGQPWLEYDESQCTWPSASTGNLFLEILDFHPLEETSVQPDQEKGVKYVKWVVEHWLARDKGSSGWMGEITEFRMPVICIGRNAKTEWAQRALVPLCRARPC